MVALVQTINLAQKDDAKQFLHLDRVHQEKWADIAQTFAVDRAQGIEKIQKRPVKEIESFADFASAQRQQTHQKEVNLFYALANAMKCLSNSDEQEIISGTMQVDLKNAELERQNDALSVLQKKIEDQVVKLNAPPHQTGWKAIVGVVVGIAIGALLAVASDGIGSALAPEVEAAISGAEEGATAVEETEEGGAAVLAEGEEGGGGAPAAYPKAAAFFSSNLTKMGLLIGSMATGSAVGNSAEQADSQKDSNAAAVANAHLQDDQTQMQKVMNELQRAENEAQNLFQILVVNPQQQQTMTQQMFGESISTLTSTTNEMFRG